MTTDGSVAVERGHVEMRFAVRDDTVDVGDLPGSLEFEVDVAVGLVVGEVRSIDIVDIQRAERADTGDDGTGVDIVLFAGLFDRLECHVAAIETDDYVSVVGFERFHVHIVGQPSE